MLKITQPPFSSQHTYLLVRFSSLLTPNSLFSSCSQEEKNKPKITKPMAELVEDPCEVPRVVTILSSLLQRVADRSDVTAHQRPQKPPMASAFAGMSKPSISVRSYLERIFSYANCSPSCYVVAYIYLDRFLHRNPAVAIDSFNVHRFIITSVLAAVKFMDDIYYNNTYFAKVGGISLMEMNYLEVDFLFGVGFELNVTPVIFNSYCSILQREMYETECSPASPRLLCSLSEEDPSSCQQQQQLVVREVFGTWTVRSKYNNDGRLR